MDYKKPKSTPDSGYKDPEFYMSHYQSAAEHDTKGFVLLFVRWSFIR